MSVSITLEISRKFNVNAQIAQVFELLANVPQSASHFPKVEELSDLGNNTYLWKMKKIGFDKHAIQTIYASQYRSDKVAGTVTWEPVKGHGNGLISGYWHLSEAGSGTECRFHTKGFLELPLPGILKLAVSPVVKHEFNALVDQYVLNLQGALAG
jgi:carbon monoxide dehydrogenase subunit G